MYHVIRYDVKGMAKHAKYGCVVNEETGKKAMTDIEPPEIITTFTTLAEAEARINELNEKSKSEEQMENVTLENDGIYSGPRFIYRMGVDPA